MLAFKMNLSSQDLIPMWGKQESSASSIAYNDIELTPFGSMVSVGWIGGPTSFEIGDEVEEITPVASVDGIVVKRAATGQIIWAKAISGDANTFPTSVEVASNGDIFIGGYFLGETDADPSENEFYITSTGGADAFLIKWSADGEFLWAKKWGSIEADYCFDLELAPNGNIVVGGEFGASMDINPGALSNWIFSNGFNDIFAVALNASGNYVWSYNAGGEYLEDLYGLAIDNNNNVFLTGSFVSEDIDFNPGAATVSLPLTGCCSDTFVLKLDDEGDFVWAGVLGGSEDGGSYPDAIETDDLGNVYIGGHCANNSDFDPGTGSAEPLGIGTENAFICQLLADGSYGWSVAFPAPFVEFHDIIVEEEFIFGTGIFTGTIDLDPSVSTLQYFSSSNDPDMFLVKLNHNGGIVFGYPFECNTVGISKIGLAYTHDKEIIFTSQLTGSVDLDPSASSSFNFTANDAYAMITAKIAQDICANFALNITSFSEVVCNGVGNVVCELSGGTEPMNILWNTDPSSNNLSFEIPETGFYSCTGTDALGCTRQLTFYANGPGADNGFDLQSHVITTSFRPGFNSDLWVKASNLNCELKDGSLTIALDPLVSLNYSNPTPDAIDGNNLTWNFSPINFQTGDFQAYLYVNTSLDAAIGDTLCFESSVSLFAEDLNSSNNQRTFCSPVINGYDPNDINVFPSGNCEEHFVNVNTDLLYTIRFQNTGNASAINIHVLDTLPSGIDINSLNILDYSHALITEVIDNHILKFKFDNIQLPDSFSNEPGSHGYVVFAIKAIEGIDEGTEFENQAAIYFDYNDPIYTNEVFSTMTYLDPQLIACSIDVMENDRNGSFNLYPNPCSDVLSIYSSTKQNFHLYDMTGKDLQPFSIQGATNIDLTRFSAGIYFLKSENGESVKIIKVD
jgi:uncharacterized repeat protein (TIGR01451 family)